MSVLPLAGLTQYAADVLKMHHQAPPEITRLAFKVGRVLPIRSARPHVGRLLACTSFSSPSPTSPTAPCALHTRTASLAASANTHRLDAFSHARSCLCGLFLVCNLRYPLSRPRLLRLFRSSWSISWILPHSKAASTDGYGVRRYACLSDGMLVCRCVNACVILNGSSVRRCEMRSCTKRPSLERRFSSVSLSLFLSSFANKTKPAFLCAHLRAPMFSSIFLFSLVFFLLSPATPQFASSRDHI